MNKLISLLNILNFVILDKQDDKTIYLLSTHDMKIRIMTKTNYDRVALAIQFTDTDRKVKSTITQIDCINYLTHNYYKEIRQNKIASILTNE